MRQLRLVPVQQRQQIQQIRNPPNDPRMRMLMHGRNELPRPPRPLRLPHARHVPVFRKGALLDVVEGGEVPNLGPNQNGGCLGFSLNHPQQSAVRAVLVGRIALRGFTVEHLVVEPRLDL